MRIPAILLICCLFAPASPVAGDGLERADELLRAIPELEEHYRYADVLHAAAEQLALRYAILGPDHPGTAAGWSLMGRLTHWVGSYARAESLLTTALRIQDRVLDPDHPDRCETLRVLGVLYKDIGRLEDAVTLESEALIRLERNYGSADPRICAALASLSHTYRRLRRNKEAESGFRRVLEIDTAAYGRQSREVSADLSWLGWFLWRLERFDEAETCFREAIAIDTRVYPSGHPRAGLALGFLSGLLASRGESNESLQLRRARARLINTREHMMPMGMTLLRQGSSAVVELAGLLDVGESEAAWGELVRAQGWINQCFWNLSRRETPTHRAARERVLALDREMLRNDGKSDAEREALLLELVRADAVRAVEAAAIVRSSPDPPTLDQLQSSLAPDEALIGWVSTDFYSTPWRATWAYVVRRTGPVRWRRLRFETRIGSGDTWWDPAVAFRSAIVRDSQWPLRVGDNPEIRGQAHAAYRMLFEPLESDLTGATRLLIVPGGWAKAAEAPLECFRDGEGRDLLERFTTVYVPAPSFVGAGDGEDRTPSLPADREALIVGDPMFSRREIGDPALIPDPTSQASLSILDAPVVRSVLEGEDGSWEHLARLPYSGYEARRVSGFFASNRLLMGSEASETTLERMRAADGLRRFGTIHLATHAVIELSQYPERSAMILSNPHLDSAETGLTDGLVSTREIFLGWQLDADLVTLSGCQTASGRTGAAMEILGFATALFRAGARSVLASQWKVDDVATALLMERFYANASGQYEEPRSGHEAGTAMDMPNALREAKLWLRELPDEEGGKPFAHPAYWAGFVLLTVDP